MKKTELPVGTVITVGHPANRVLAVKIDMEGNEWRYLHTGALMDYDDKAKASWDMYAEASA